MGDIRDGENNYYRPEFEEAIFNSANTRDTPESALARQLSEEQRESSLSFGSGHKDGYFRRDRRLGNMRYAPRLKLKDANVDYQPVGKISSYVMASLQRPSIMDIDTLFALKPTVPGSIRPSSVVQADPTYHQAGRFWEARQPTCRAEKNIGSLFGLYCGRNAQERC